jgi:hypothetical protein
LTITILPTPTLENGTFVSNDATPLSLHHHIIAITLFIICTKRLQVRWYRSSQMITSTASAGRVSFFATAAAACVVEVVGGRGGVVEGGDEARQQVHTNATGLSIGTLGDGVALLCLRSFVCVVAVAAATAGVLADGALVALLTGARLAAASLNAICSAITKSSLPIHG